MANWCLSIHCILFAFLVSARKAPKEADIKGAECRAPARQIRPFMKSPAAFPIHRSTLTYILSMAKMFRFLPCRASTDKNGRAGRAEPLPQIGRETCNPRTLRCCADAKCGPGGVHRRGCCRAQRIFLYNDCRGNHTSPNRLWCGSLPADSASPMTISLVTFLFGYKKVTPITS